MSASVAADVDCRAALEELMGAVHVGSPEQIAFLVSRVIGRWGLVAAWDQVLAPVLGLIGDSWFDGELDVSQESIASWVLTGELREVTRRRRPRAGRAEAIVLAGVGADEHALPVLALEAALAEHGLDATNLGSRPPVRSLQHVLARKQPEVVFLWSSMPRPALDPIWDAFASAGPTTRVVLGGPGWPNDPCTSHGMVDRPSTLAAAVISVVDALG